MSELGLLFRTREAARSEAMGPERAQQSMPVWLAWIRDLEARGHLKDPGQPLDPGGKVVRGPTARVTDGLSARDLAQAAELAQGCPMLAADGSVEIRPVGKR